MRSLLGNNTLLNAQGAVGGDSAAIFVGDYKTVTLEVATVNSANLVCMIKVSNQATKPDFTAAATPTNRWSYAQIKNYNDESGVNGTVGISPTGTDINQLYELNTNFVRWIGAKVTTWVAGQISIFVDGANDNIPA